MRYLARKQSERCTVDITLRDGSQAQCQRYRTAGPCCTQHARRFPEIAFPCCGGNDEAPPDHCMDCAAAAQEPQP